MRERRLKEAVGILSPEALVRCLRNWGWSRDGLGAGGVGLGVLGQIHGFRLKVLGVAVSAGRHLLQRTGSDGAGILGS